MWDYSSSPQGLTFVFLHPLAVVGLTGGATEEGPGRGQDHGIGQTRERESESLELCHQHENPPIAWRTLGPDLRRQFVSLWLLSQGTLPMPPLDESHQDRAGCSPVRPH